MDCDPFRYDLPTAYKGCTWDGLTWTVDSVTDGSTEFAATLSSARFQLQDAAGNIALTLSSAAAGEVTINATTANAWSVTVESRSLNLAAGTYTYALETTDADGVIKPRMIGTLRIKPEPVK